MRVPFSYLKEQFQDHQVYLDKISEVVSTGDYTLGKAVTEFEQRFAALLGAKYAIGVNSGTDALFLSLKAMGVGPGDEVITTPNTFIATVGAIVASGARPVFVDCNDEYVINADLIEPAITSRTRAIMPVHYAGVTADMDKIMIVARQHGLPVIEDACQAILGALQGKCAGTFGLTGAFSLHPLKNLNVWGDSGVIITDNEEIRDRLVLIRNHGLINRDEVACFGYNSRLDTIQAAVGNHLIQEIHWITETRIKWAHRLDQALSQLFGCITVPQRRPHKRYVHHLYMVQARDRDKLLAFLESNDIEAKVHYPIPLHLQRCSAHLGYQEGDFPVTEALAQSIITLPAHQHLKEGHIGYIIDKIKEFYL
jgi:dTDP-3-amino-2,3,6-trideoxy-4-keto-D-glucose/dTDP-3-amino-3,4,6-trideoxy-alpha-D-glucose/dTDP-2,6-dideoxy-D-kanosamine transaminase